MFCFLGFLFSPLSPAFLSGGDIKCLGGGEETNVLSGTRKGVSCPQWAWLAVPAVSVEHVSDLGIRCLVLRSIRLWLSHYLLMTLPLSLSSVTSRPQTPSWLLFLSEFQNLLEDLGKLPDFLPTPWGSSGPKSFLLAWLLLWLLTILLPWYGQYSTKHGISSQNNQPSTNCTYIL